MHFFKKHLFLSLLLPLLFSAPLLWTTCADASEEMVRVSIIPHRSNLGNERAYAAVFEALKKETGLKFQWIGGKTYEDVIQNIVTGKADIGYVGPFSYVDAQDNYGVRLICRTLSKNGQEFYRSMIITGKDSGINSLQDLKGKHFSFTDPKSTSGYLFPMRQLKKVGLSLDDFSEVHYLKRHANSLLAVVKAHVDAGATSSTAVDKVDVDLDGIKVLWKSEPIYRGPWIARQDMSDELYEKIQQGMFAVSRLEQADEIFKGLTTKGFVAGRDSDYDNVREVVRIMEAEK